MPPRKRARHSRATTTTASPSPSAEAITTPTKSSPVPVPPTTDDQWSDAEETALFRALLRYKPTGIHKHHRMLSLHSWLVSNNLIDPDNEHTRPAGIWAKLETLYDLAALDAREDARQLERIPGFEEEGVLDGDWSEAENLVENGEFGLPVEEDEGLRREVWGRRLRSKGDGDGEESEGELEDVNLARTPPRVLDLKTGVEPGEVSPSSKKGKGGARGKKAKEVELGRRGSLAQAPSRRSARQAESTADENEAPSVDERQEDEAEEENDEGEEGDESDDKESRASTPAAAAARSTRSKGGAAAKGGSRAKGRARPKK